MFVRYEINGVAANTKTTTAAILKDIQGIVNGSITSTASLNATVCIISSSEITGAANTTTYPVANITLYTDNTSSTAAANADYLQIYKSHYYSNSTYLSQAKQTIQIAWDLQTYGPRVRIGNGSANNYHPVNLANLQGGWWDTSNTYIFAPSNQPQSLNRIFLYISDYYFIAQFVKGNTVGTAGILDWEPSDSDNYAMSLSANTYPGVRLFAYNFTDLGNAQSANTLDAFGIMQSDFMNSAGYLRLNRTGNTNPHANTNANTQYNMGVGIPSNGVSFATFYPHPMYEVNPHYYAGATTINPVIPLQLMPHFNYAGWANSTSNELGVWTRFPYIYRTNDNMGALGDSVTYAGNTYAIMLLNKTGGNGQFDTSANRNAAYLLPKLIYANTSGY
jgi:hypothetical protein